MVENLIRNEEKTEIKKAHQNFQILISRSGQRSHLNFSEEMPGASDEEEVLISSLSLSSFMSTSSSSSLSTSLSSSLPPSLSLPLSSFFCQHARNQHQHLRYQVLAYTVSQLSISPENTIFHFLHLDVGEVQKKLHRQKNNPIFLPPPQNIYFQGVFLAPLVPPSGPYHTQVLDNFRSLLSASQS